MENKYNRQFRIPANIAGEQVSIKKYKAKKSHIKTEKKRGIAFRMQLLLLIFITGVFTAIFITFNFFISDYISRETKSKLDQASDFITNVSGFTITNGFGRWVFKDIPKDQIASNPLLYEQFYRAVINKLHEPQFNSEITATMFSSDSFERIFPSDAFSFTENIIEMDTIISKIKNEKIGFGTNKKIFTGKNYYLTQINLEEVYGLSRLSLALYVNIDRYTNMVDNMNLVLVIIIITAFIFSFLYVLFISKNITKPIKQLCNFADAIGSGNFRQNDYNFKDRELYDLNRRMNDTAVKLEQNDTDKKIFFQNVSHELKTPLMSIKGYAEGIKYGVFEDSESMNDAADIIISESDRLNNLVLDLLYISKMDSGQKTEEKTEIDICELVGGCFERLRGILINTDKNIELSIPDKPLYFKCNEDSMLRAVLNVMANCVQYAKKTVDVAISENAGGTIIKIHDDGDGIAEKDMPHIFKRFYKGSKGKHGIGLAITKSVIDQHEAKIEVKNNNGAEFIITLPKKKEQ